MNAANLIFNLIKVAAVFGLLVLTLKMLAKNKGLRGEGVSGSTDATGPTVEILNKTRVGKTSSVITIRVGDRAVLLGVTETQITHLADVSEELVIDLSEPDPQEQRESVLEEANNVLGALYNGDIERIARPKPSLLNAPARLREARKR